MNPVMADRGDKPLIETKAQNAETKPVARFNAEHRRVGRPTLDNGLGLCTVL
jgi:hypothetical protein